MIPYRPDLKQKARELRRSMTDAEQKLWQQLRGKQLHGVQFYRQKPIGNYIVDFYAPAAKLVIELDGSQHFEPDSQAYDRKRGDWLNQQGIAVLRFDDRQALMETEAVMAEIERVLARFENPPQSPFKKGGSTDESPLEKGESTDESPLGKGGSIDESPLGKGGSTDKSPFGKGDSSDKSAVGKGESTDKSAVGKGESTDESPLGEGGDDEKSPFEKGGFRGISSNDRPFLYIAVGVLRAPDGRVLIAKRLPDKPGAGKWEFPGGKREDGESVDAALARELNEELGIEVRRTRPLLCFSHDYSDRRVLLDIHEVTAWHGEAHGREGQTLAWCRPENLFDYDLLDANAPVVAALRLPDRYLITPEPENGHQEFLRRADRALADGIRLLRLRAPSLDDADYEALARALQARAEARGAALLLDRDAAMAERIGTAGLHLPAKALDELTERPLPASHWFAVSCHDRTELQRALALGADFATLSPVAATASHPGAAPLGWDGFAAARDDLAIPVYALGGLGPADIERARVHGAQGIAAVSAFFIDK